MASHKAHLGDPPEVEVSRRFFTVEQANRALVLVRRIVRDVLDDYQLVLELQEMLEDRQRNGADADVRDLQRQIIQRVERLQGFSDELVDIGAEVKDWTTGVVDFPTVAAGREVRLCWRYGEETVTHWHTDDEGCPGRRAIDSMPVESTEPLLLMN